jgi:hypothetical protein
MSSSAAIDEFLLRTNKAYEARHLEYENHFWSTKMALAGASTQVKLLAVIFALVIYLSNEKK